MAKSSRYRALLSAASAFLALAGAGSAWSADMPLAAEPVRPDVMEELTAAGAALSDVATVAYLQSKFNLAGGCSRGYLKLAYKAPLLGFRFDHGCRGSQFSATVDMRYVYNVKYDNGVYFACNDTCGLQGYVRSDAKRQAVQYVHIVYPLTSEPEIGRIVNALMHLARLNQQTPAPKDRFDKP